MKGASEKMGSSDTQNDLTQKNIAFIEHYQRANLLERIVLNLLLRVNGTILTNTVVFISRLVITVIRVMRQRYVRISGQKVIIENAYGSQSYWAYNLESNSYRIVTTKDNRTADIKRASSEIKKLILFLKQQDMQH